MKRSKLALIEEFCRAPTCRQQMLLRALGGEGGPCGRCDNCRKGFVQLRRVARLPLSHAAYLRSRALRAMRSLIDARMPVHDDPVHPEGQAVAPPRQEPDSSAGLTIAQQRALLRMKSARLRIAQRRRCSPARLLPDAALCELALANSPSPAVIRETFARHEIRDESLTRAFAEILQNELQNI